ncbi:MAG: AraC family transcriptional regulator [Chitinophagaceae bacterium]
MKRDNAIRLYHTHTFTARHMPSPELDALLKNDFNKFFIVRVEEMYRHVKQEVPASRSFNHSCLFITSGSAVMRVGDLEYTIGKNELLFVPAGQVFSFRPGDINKGYLFHFNNDLFATRIGKREHLDLFEFLQVWGNPLVKPGDNVAGYIHNTLSRVLQEYTENGLKDTELIAAYLLSLFCEINKAYSTVANRGVNTVQHTVNRFKELLSLHYQTTHFVKDYARMLQVTPNHLNKLIKAGTGKTAGKWIDELIITEARMLLLQTDLSVNEVSSKVGCDDPSYFIRLFKKYEHITPAAYRKMIEMS